MVTERIDPAAARVLLAGQERLLIEVANGTRSPNDSQRDYSSGHEEIKVVAKALGLTKCPCPWSHVVQWHATAAAVEPGKVQDLLDDRFSEIRGLVNSLQDPPKYKLSLYQRSGDPKDRPFLRWQQRELSECKQFILDAHLKGKLAVLGPEVARDPTQGEKISRNGHSVTEHKIRCDAKAYGYPKETINLRVFFVTVDNRIVLLHGYDKGTDVSEKRQQREIAEAFRRLSDYEQQKNSSAQ